MSLIRATLLASAALCALATPSFAADTTDGFKWENLQIRVRAINVNPDVDSTVSAGGTVSASTTTVPELDFTYFWTDHIASELILATTKHDMDTSAAGSIGDVWLLPPTLTLQYHFNTREATFRPYVGAGLNYTFFYNEDPSPVASVNYKNGMGFALQAGFDYGISKNWAINFDVKKLFLNTKAVVNGAVNADVDLDPWISGVGLSYRF